MPAPLRVIINGKFLLAKTTGVHRVAAELIQHLHAVLAERPDLQEQLKPELWIPATAEAKALALGVPYTIVRPFSGRIWEQVTLPLRSSRQIVLSLCNVGVLAKRNGITMIHDAQIHITPASYSPAFRAWYKFQQAIVGRRQRLILTVSEFSRTQLIRYGVAPAGKVTVIPNGVDHLAGHSADPGIVTRLGLVPQGYVTALANVQAHKNIPVLFEAFRAPACSAIPLVLFGQATRAEFLAAGYDAPANVVFAGNLSDGELRALYENALCLAFPSTTEGFGLPPLEAMLVGCPVIAAPAGALPEVCGNAALFADPHDPAEWTNRIVELATDENTRQQLIAAGRARAGSFTWRRAAERLAETLLDYRARAIEP